ncbi:hypothetical protein L6164_018828 [Bauhinia variegata]|uniref:Uncharacterized protein n=1 Tax=Bauhinia variegata TaxID=167791 RepID=A0ACB9NFY0_BAUVA|nr:hypothetical protein L6164_018828 [Bauhinia variegata]
MGNCLRNNKVSAHNELSREPGKPEAVEQMKTRASSKFKTAPHEERVKKMVRFKLREGDGGGSDSRTGPVRIRLIVTQQEFQRMLSLKEDPQCTSLEQLLSAVKLKGRRMCEVGENEGGLTPLTPWRPALESIPEDRSMK